MFQNKMFISKVILAAIAIISLGTMVGVVFYSLSLKKSTPVVELTPEPTVMPTVKSTPKPAATSTTTSEIDISDWETYSNSKYGFEIKYPSNNWQIEEYSNNDIPKILISSTILRSDMPEGGGSIIINVRDISLDNFISEYNEENKLFCENVITKKEKFILNNFETTKITGCTALGIDANFIFIRKKSKSYIIEYQDYDPIHNKIISTFRFTE